MADQDVLDTLSQFVGRLTAGPPADDVLPDLLRQVTHVLAVQGAAVSQSESGCMRPVAAIGKPAVAAERAQADAGQGPCIEVLRYGRPVLCADLRAEPARWPAFGGRARDAGIVAVAGVPMRLSDSSPASLSLYATAPRHWTEHDVATARALAEITSSYLAHKRELEHARRTARQLQEALDSRIVIEQAKGMIAAERSITVDDAFTIIRAHARRRRVPLKDIAHAVVHLGLRP